MLSSGQCVALAVAAASLQSVAAIPLDVNDASSVKAAAAQVAKNVYAYYGNNGSNPATKDFQIGLFPYPPYYWWESGAAWTGLIDYWAWTKDDTYNNDSMVAMNAQVGPKFDFVVPEQTFDEANDDQAFWVYSALSALEYKLPPLPCPPGTSSYGNTKCPNDYLNLAVNAFNDYVGRWNHDKATCGGGLKWQFTPSQKGYDYKNSVSNGGFFNVAARLARYTGNQTYADWATTVYDWSSEIGFISPDFHVFDGVGEETNCSSSEIDKTEWSYNIGTYMYGAAAMVDYTKGSGPWTDRVNGFLTAATARFFSPFPNATNILYEPCEPVTDGKGCNTDEYSFKAYLSRWMAKSAMLVPSIAPQVNTLLQASAAAAAKSCDGLGNSTCGTRWYTGGFDGTSGLGQQITALETISALLVSQGGVPAKM